MSKEVEIHPIQAAALRVLMFQPTASFTELNTGKVATDQFNFHLKQLIKSGLVRKDSKAKYELTAKGKEFTNRFDVDTKDVKYERQAKLGVLVCARKKVGKEYYWLLQQRLKQPFFGYYGRITGKIRWGETAEEAAHRELMEEAGLTATMKFKGVAHKMDYAPTGELLEEKFFFVFLADNAKGKLMEEIVGGKNAWYTWDEKKKLKNQFKDMKNVDDILKSPTMKFTEKKYIADRY